MLFSTLLSTLLAVPMAAGTPLPLAMERSHTLEPRDAMTGVTTLKSELPLGTNFCLDEDQGSGRVQMWQCHAGTNQQWRLEKVRLDIDNFKAKSITRFRVRRVDTDMCLHFVAPGSGDHYDISREYDIPLSLVPCDSAARFTWQDASLCAFLGNGVDFYVKNGRDYGFCVSPANAEESGMGNGDTLAVRSDPEFRMKFVTRLARADASELAEYGLPVKTGARQVWHP